MAAQCSTGTPAFRQTFLTMPIELPEAKLDKSGTRDPAVMSKVTTVGYAAVIQAALNKAIKEKGISTEGMTPKDIAGIISLEAPWILMLIFALWLILLDTVFIIISV